MKIDQDDIPEYIRARKPSPWSPLHAIAKWSIAGLFGIGITAGALYFVDGNMAQLARNAQVARTPTTHIAPPTPSKRTPTESTYDDYDAQVARALEASKNTSIQEAKIEWGEPEKSHQAQGIKNTSFNDSNYIPRKADNIARHSPPQQPETTVKQQSPTKIVVVGKQEDPNPGCTFAFKEGSIERRNCNARSNLSKRNQ